MTLTAVATSEVRWLLDVDGVLNASRPGWGAAPRRGIAVAGAEPWTIRWAPALMRRIRTIHTAGQVEIVWCTTWCPWADQIERLLGLPALGRAWNDEELFGRPALEAKRDAARRALAEGRRLIWTDDDAIPRGPYRVGLDGALLIEPDPRKGLQPEDLDRIEAFVADSTFTDLVQLGESLRVS